jgi:hypothetical protein
MEVRFVAWLIWLIHLAFRQLTACLCMVHFVPSIRGAMRFDLFSGHAGFHYEDLLCGVADLAHPHGVPPDGHGRSTG